jgi:hypothetical protein
MQLIGRIRFVVYITVVRQAQVLIARALSFVIGFMVMPYASKPIIARIDTFTNGWKARSELGYDFAWKMQPALARALDLPLCTHCHFVMYTDANHSECESAYRRTGFFVELLVIVDNGAPARGTLTLTDDDGAFTYLQESLDARRACEIDTRCVRDPILTAPFGYHLNSLPWLRQSNTSGWGTGYFDNGVWFSWFDSDAMTALEQTVRYGELEADRLADYTPGDCTCGHPVHYHDSWSGRCSGLSAYEDGRCECDHYMEKE